ncbi:hypothetical protein BGX34_001685 [Mortierella sp. NVP85]|nr:hypothetical protein BGX34_001685 [Mortierella sp. NVP85]
MVFNRIVSSPLEILSLQHALDLAKIYLENASKAQHSDIALVLCHDTELALSQAKSAAKCIEDQSVRKDIAKAYIGLGRELDNRGRTNEAQKSYKKAEKWGVNVLDQDQGDPTHTTVPSEKKRKQVNQTATIPQHIFAENIIPPSLVTKLPGIDERLSGTPQLACCLSLLKASHSLDSILEPVARSWIQTVEKDVDERERLKLLSLDVIRNYKRDEFKDASVVAEVVYLAPVLDKDAFRDLLNEFYDGIDRSGLLNFHQLDGLAQLIQGADVEYLDADDLVKILGLLNKRLHDTHQKSQKHIHQLALTASHVLDVMADTKVSGLDREKLHEPLSSYLDSLKESPDPYLVYQAAYAYQALLCVPDDETLWQAAFRRTDKVVRGLAGLVKAVKGLDLNGFIDGLKDIHQGLAGISETTHAVKRAYDGMTSLIGSGQGFMDGLREGFSFKRKCAWYPALRGADALIQNGEFASFKRLVCEAPCRLDPAFQWGVCQRLGEIAANTTWDTLTRRSAVAFLGEMYCNDEDWGQDVGIKEWILVILMRLSSPSEDDDHFAEAVLHVLESNANTQQRTLIKTYREKNPTSYPLKVALPPLASPSLLDRVQNKPDVEGTLRQLKKQRLKERGNAVYIQPLAKSGLQASDDQRFPLMGKVEDYLDSDQKVFLLLGDSGAGKSTFNRYLECELWSKYKKNTGRIPLFVNLPAIDKPEQDMIAKQLRKAEFTEPEIRELKLHRKFILICDGYDESQQTHNLYVSNQLNQPGEWNVQMVVSCRSECLGVDYRDRFQPGDRNSRAEPDQFQEAVITSFTPDQVQDYIKQYVSVRQPLWEVKDYKQALDLIPGLKELVRNPFLMTLSLEVLPRMVDPGEHLSVAHITRVALYDQFVEHWLERGKKRLSEKELSPQAKAAFESLTDEGFTQNGIDFLKKLSVAIYEMQDGHPIVNYSRFKDEGSWKTAFFSREDEKQLLREACPLTRNGNQHRFIHRSLLEYGIALAVFDPNDWKERSMSTTLSKRRGSMNSDYSFRIHGSAQDVMAPVEQGPNMSSPLARRYFVNEPSILQFLCERVRQKPMFKRQLLDYIEHSKSDKKWRTAAANAITILVRAGIQFVNGDLRGIQIPGADLSFGVFELAQLQDADLRQVNLRGAWLSQADLSRAQMRGIQFGELPYLQEVCKVSSCAYSPDGKSLALGLSVKSPTYNLWSSRCVPLINGIIRLYSTSSWEQIRTLTGHRNAVNCIVYSPRGDRIMSCSSDYTARLWDVESGTCIRILSDHNDPVNSVAFSPLGDTVASASSDRTVRVWDVETGACRLTLTSHNREFSSVVYSPMGNRIALGERMSSVSSFVSRRCAVRVLDVDAGESLHDLSGHSGSIWGVAYSPRGGRVASGSGDSTVRIWDVEAGACCRVLTDHGGEVYSVAFSFQGDMIVSAGEDKTVRLWDAESGTCHQIFTGHSRNIRCAVFSPKGDHIASGSDDETVRLWDVGSGGTREVTIGHDGKVLSVVYTPHANQVVSCGHDGSIKFWDAESGVCRRTIASYLYSVANIAYSPRGDVVITGVFERKKMERELLNLFGQPFIQDGTEGSIVFSYSLEGDQGASEDSGGWTRIGDVISSEQHYTLSDHSENVIEIVNSPKGIYIVSSNWSGTVNIRNIEFGAHVSTLHGHSGYVASVVYSPRGDLFASSGCDSSVRLWDVETGDCRRILIGHTTLVPVVVFSPRGDQVTSGCCDGQVKIWDVETGERIFMFTGHTESVKSFAYSPKGDRIISSSEDKTFRLWDLSSGQCRAVVRELKSPVERIAWSTTSDATCFVTGCTDGSVCMWQVAEEGDTCRIRWRWRSISGELNLTDMTIQDVRGLSQVNKQLLKQRGALGEPFDHLREAGQKVLCMASVVSSLKQPSISMVLEASSALSSVAEQSEQLEFSGEQK